jgi:hypothetical protein
MMRISTKLLVNSNTQFNPTPYGMLSFICLEPQFSIAPKVDGSKRDPNMDMNIKHAKVLLTFFLPDLRIVDGEFQST